MWLGISFEGISILKWEHSKKIIVKKDIEYRINMTLNDNVEYHEYIINQKS